MANKGFPLTMTIHEARLVAELRDVQSYTQRAIAAVYFPPDHNGHGNQLAGLEILQEAASILKLNPNEDFNDWDRDKTLGE